MLGSGFVFLMRKDMPVRLQKALLGFASGVMVAASFVHFIGILCRHKESGSKAAFYC